MRFLLHVLAMITGLFFVSTALQAQDAEIINVEKKKPATGVVAIGDPKEIFLVEEKKDKEKDSEGEIGEDPKTMTEFLGYLRNDLKLVGRELSGLKDELMKLEKHTFNDTDFIPPKRPDWR